MRLSSTLVLLPALAAAQNQFPFAEQLQGLIEKAKSFLPAAPPVAAPAQESTAPPPVIPKRTKNVASIQQNNWQTLLAPVSADTPAESREWLIYITGGNKTCFGRCGRVDKAWNESIPLFAADPNSPSLGVIDCEKEPLLCSIWPASPPSLWHLQLPVAAEAGQPRPPTAIHTVRLNATTTTALDIFKVHSEKGWEKEPAMEGLYHPMDGKLAQYNLIVPLGYIVYGFNQVPSWLMMLGISFISRSVMGRRNAAQQGRRPAAGPAAPQAPATQ